MQEIPEFLNRLQHEDAVWVTVVGHRGSAPRHEDAWMGVFAIGSVGTVGGGTLEWQAVDHARRVLRAAAAAGQREFTLGPDQDQCCGGRVTLRFEPVSAADVPRLRQEFERRAAAWPTVAVLGAGHVGRALVRVLQPLPLHTVWVDERAPMLAPEWVQGATRVRVQTAAAAVAELPLGAHVVVATHSHAQDYAAVAACLARASSLGFIGLVGSRSKWAAFQHRLRLQGFCPSLFPRVACPVGLAGVGGRDPASIAVAVAAQLLLAQSHLPKSCGPNGREPTED